MQKSYKIAVIFAIASYGLKFLIDAVMFIFTLYGRGDIYYDDWYLFLPQAVSTLLIIGFYCMFFTKPFIGLFIKITTAVLILLNIAFMGILIFDRSQGYVLYFALVAAVNFLNALFLKCNIIPMRKPGTIEYGPMIFELISFAVMALSLYALFCSFPLQYNAIIMQWSFYNVMSGMRINIVCASVLFFEYILCFKNDCEYIRDNMFVEEEFPPEML